MDESSRKPIPEGKLSAQIVLNDFLKEKGILLGTQQSEIERTGKGSLIIHPPIIIAVYADETNKVN